MRQVFLDKLSAAGIARLQESLPAQGKIRRTHGANLMWSVAAVTTHVPIFQGGEGFPLCKRGQYFRQSTGRAENTLKMFDGSDCVDLASALPGS